MFKYKPRHFAVHELVPSKVFNDRGQKALHLMNAQVLEIADTLREIYGPAFVNTYGLSQGIQDAYGLREWSGLRTPDSEWYRPYSQHTFGNALDMLFKDYTAQQIRQDIVEGIIELPYDVVLEKSVSWLHVATANYDSKITLVDG